MEGEEDGDWMMMEMPGGKGGSKAGSVDRKKRFSEEQIKSLESMFATQTKLEPRQKLQLARELGLQPRQVAIWFQNKRARWKSKQLEREYSSLRDDYDSLLCSYHSLKEEKLALLNQLEKLAEMLQEPRGKYADNADAGGGDDVRCGMKEEEEFVDAALYTSSEGGGRGTKVSTHFAGGGDDDGDDAGLFLRPASQSQQAGFTASGPEQHQSSTSSFQFNSSWPSSTTEQTCSSSQWWEFESLSE